MARTRTIAAAAFATLLGAAACTDSSAPPPPLRPEATNPQLLLFSGLPKGCDPVRAYWLISALYKDYKISLETKARLAEALIQLRTSQDKGKTLLLLVVEQIGHDANEGKLADPNGTLPPTTREAAFELSNILLICGGLPPIPAVALEAFTPFGAVEIVDGSQGGEAITGDEQSGTLIPANAFTGQRVVTIIPKTADAYGNTCLGAAGAKVRQYGQCYDYQLTPALAPGEKFAEKVLNVICAYEAGAGPGQPPTHDIHESVTIATVDPADPTQLEVGTPVEHTFAQKVSCEGQSLPVASRGLGERLFGTAWSRVGSMVAVVTRPFRPTTAHAADGLGVFFDHWTNFRLVDRRPDAAHESSPAFSLSASEANVGGTVTVNASSVVNFGGGTIESLAARYYLSDDAQITTADVPLGSEINVGTLRAGRSGSLAAITLTIPATTTAGPKFVGLLLDPANAYTESEEGNNAVAAPLTVVDPNHHDQRRAGEIAIYKDYNAWFGTNRDETVLRGAPFNFVSGTNYFVRPMSGLRSAIPEATSLIIITSASDGDISRIPGDNVGQVSDQRAGAANLEAWVRAGGWLVIHAGDNSAIGYTIPGTTADVDNVNSCTGLTLSVGNHALVRGPDGALGTGDDDLTNDNIDQAPNVCFNNHGSLNGILPANAEVLMHEEGGGMRPVYATYTLGRGRVIVGTLTFEFNGHPVRTLINHFYWAINGVNAPGAQLNVARSRVATLNLTGAEEPTVHSDGSPRTQP